jgi:hypothetical protein
MQYYLPELEHTIKPVSLRPDQQSVFVSLYRSGQTVA